MTTNDRSRVLCLGEAMVVLRPEQPGGLAGSDLLRRSVGGAEANVAGALVALGISTCWLSRLGSDPFGDYVARDLQERGVNVLAEHDEVHPTGVYLKDSGPAGSRMFYYRSGSAAAAMTGALLDDAAVVDALEHCDAVHTSGITAGILASDSDLLRRLVDARDRHGFVLSVDLNWRPALWRGRDTSTLCDLLRAADVVLLGEDEAGVALGASTPEQVREIVGDRPRIVLKSDAHVAREITPEGVTTAVRALQVEVVEPVGAGDGFAAGYLTGMLCGYDAKERLRLGHLSAASVLAEPGDHASRLPDATVRRALVTATDEDWAHTSVSCRGIESPALQAIRGAK
ncbi:sugar kinase [Flexivirga endophytica]|uniref:sugar kinase n=1 Tax=Flexivirga endophytica TaxID=1849103 RepID=UPI001E3DD491|nr:sugar kinase [Flexivirga endophytica]